MQNHTHIADREREIAGWDSVVTGEDPRVLNTDYPGKQPSTQVDVFGTGWRATVNELFAVQKYKGTAAERCRQSSEVEKAECYAMYEDAPAVQIFDSAPIVDLPSV